MPRKTKTTGGIVLPGEVAERPNRGVVIAVGSGRVLGTSSVSALEVSAS